jgi:ABC-2 type transport system ATP-binding protein
MRQRPGVARLPADPRLLIVDEPASGLDPGGVVEFRQMIRSLVDDGRAVVLSLHLLDEAEKICDAAAIADRGALSPRAPSPTCSPRGPGPLGCRSAALPGSAAAHQPPGGPLSIGGWPPGPGRARPGPGGQARSAAADLNRRLVEAGVAPYRLDLPAATLEERFLQITHTMREEVAA